MAAPVDYSRNGLKVIDVRRQQSLHMKVLGRLVARIEAAETAGSTNRERWLRNEQIYSAYVDLEAADRVKKAQAQDKGRPEYVTIHLPYAYGMLLSAHTYITSTLFARNPVWDFQGRHGEAEQNVMAMKALIDYQVGIGGHLPAYYGWTHDSLRYGFGVIGVKWCEHMVRVRRVAKALKTFLGIPIPGSETTVETIDEVPGYRGNETYNIRPADFGWDPRFTITNFQRGEFVTRSLNISRMDMWDKEQFFNQDWIKSAAGATVGENTSWNDIPQPTDFSTMDDDESDRLMPAHEVYVRLIPSEWDLGKGDRPEKWVFLVLNKSLIVRARPLDSFSDMWPFAIAPGEVEPYDSVPRSQLEVTEPLNATMNWLLNSHMFNVRATLNNMLVVDPSRLMISDMMGPNPGRIIRAKPTAYGQDMRTTYSQLAVSDITRSNLSDMELMGQMMQRAAGVNDNMMGQIAGGRRTATEMRSVNTMGISRMKTLVEYQSAVGYSPLTQILTQNSQQYYDAPLKLRIVGDQVMDAVKFVDVTPEAIAGFYDLIPVDGTMPVDRLAMVNTWQMLLQGMAAVPQVMQQYDIGKIFGYVAQLAGIRDLRQFKVQVNMLPPGVAPPSNVVPIGRAPGLDNSGAPVMPQAPGGLGPIG